MKSKLNTTKLTRMLTLPALIFVSALPTAFGQLATTTNWTGADGDSENWNVAGNWDAGVPGTGSSAGLQAGLYVATSADAATDLIQLAVNSGSSLNLTHVLGIIGTPFINNEDPEPDVQPSGGLYLGGNGLGTGLIEISDGGVLSVTAGDLRLGNGGGVGGGSGTIYVDAGGSLLISGVGTRIGQDATGAMTLVDTGVITTDSEFIIGTEGGGNGTYTQTGGTLTQTSGDFRVGAFGGTGVCNISGGTANIANVRLNFAGIGTGTITQSGTSIVNHSGEFAIGWANSGNATYNMQGGTLTSNNRIRFGIGDAVRTNLFNQTGGEVSVSGRIDLGEDAGPTNTYNISGGSVTLVGNQQILVGAFNASTGTLNVSGDALVDVGDISIGATGTAVGTVNLNGGTVSLVKVYSGSSTALEQFLNLNGTTLKAKQNDGNFINGTTLVVDLQAGGCTVDNNGFELNINSAIGGVGTLTKTSAGVLRLIADNTYEGGTTIAGGQVQVTTDAKLGSTVSAYTLTFDGGMLKNSDSEVDLSANRTVVLADGSWGSIVAGWGKRISIAGKVTGSGDLWVANEGGPVRLDNPANDYTGETFIGNYETGYPFATTAKLQLGADDVIPDASLIRFDGDVNDNLTTVTGILDMNGHNETICGLEILSGNASIQNGTGSATLSIGAEDTDSYFDGVIQDNISLVKIGAGTLTLAGTNTYSGGTTVDDGVLEVTGNSIADGTTLSINGGKVLVTGVETVDTLFLDGAPQLAGTYGGTGSGADNILPDSFEDGSPGDVVNVLSDASIGGYDSWAGGFGAGFNGSNNGATQDADLDGIENVLEYVLGGDPLVSDSSILPDQIPDLSDFIFTFTRSQDSKTDVALTFEYGSDLVGWTPVAIGATSDLPVVSIAEGVDPAPDTVTITIPKDVNTELFGRLKAVK